MFISQILFYISSITFSISWTVNHYGLCFYVEPIEDSAEIIASLSLGLNLLSFILILFLRLFYGFYETPYSVSKQMTVSFSLLISIISITGFTLTIYFLAFQRNLIAIFTIFGIFLLIFTITSQCLAFIFVYKLYQLHLQSIIDGRDSNKIVLEPKQGRVNNVHNHFTNNADLIKTMTKYSILSIIAVIGITLTMIISFIRIATGKHHTISRQLFALAIFIGPVSDTICVSLTYTFADKYYRKFCNKLAQSFATRCSIMAENHAFQIQSDNQQDIKRTSGDSINITKI